MHAVPRAATQRSRGPSSSPKGGGEPRILYWYRTPPGVKVGRDPFDAATRRALEGQYPGIAFDWRRIAETPFPPPDAEYWRERRRAEKAAKQARRAVREEGVGQDEVEVQEEAEAAQLEAAQVEDEAPRDDESSPDYEGGGAGERELSSEDDSEASEAVDVAEESAIDLQAIVDSPADSPGGAGQPAALLPQVASESAHEATAHDSTPEPARRRPESRRRSRRRRRGRRGGSGSGHPPSGPGPAG